MLINIWTLLRGSTLSLREIPQVCVMLLNITLPRAGDTTHVQAQGVKGEDMFEQVSLVHEGTTINHAHSRSLDTVLHFWLILRSDSAIQFIITQWWTSDMTGYSLDHKNAIIHSSGVNETGQDDHSVKLDLLSESWWALGSRVVQGIWSFILC